MRRVLTMMVMAGVALACQPAAAQGARSTATTAQVPLSPAPLLGIGKDLEGRPIPFGVPPYHPPETPLGSGPLKAVMIAEPDLPEHIVYRPANLASAGKLPIIAWGNGACIHAGNRFRSFLTEVASHGFLVISAGRMGHEALEVGPQENPRVLLPGQPAPPPAPPAAPIPNDRTATWRAMRSNADHLKQAIDWAIAENGRAGSPLQGRIDTTKVAVAGQSCGGGLATTAAADPRVTTVAILNSGTRLVPPPGNTTPPAEYRAQGEARLNGIHSPVLLLTGDQKLDSAYTGGQDTFAYLSRVPVFLAWQDGLGHIATYGAPNGGSVGRIASDWFKWRLKGDQQAGRMFSGPNCTLCREPTWHVQKKNMR